MKRFVQIKYIFSMTRFVVAQLTSLLRILHFKYIKWTNALPLFPLTIEWNRILSPKFQFPNLSKYLSDQSSTFDLPVVQFLSLIYLPQCHWQLSGRGMEVTGSIPAQFQLFVNFQISCASELTMIVTSNFYSREYFPTIL